MKAYITANGVISPQETHSTADFPETVRDVLGNRLTCIEPDYKVLINPIQLRRMPRILKMGLASAQLCLNRGGGVQPDAIIVGTGLGCLENLEKFLLGIIENRERVTSVLPFINSTHNAVAAQIAMLLQNHGYNLTYCHRAFSFESALLDALMFLEEKNGCHVLAGGIDECTSDFLRIHSYLGFWKDAVSNLELYNMGGPGTIAGEGSAFFMLSAHPSGAYSVGIDDVRTFFIPGGQDAAIKIYDETDIFLKHNGLSKSDIDLVVGGMNGDTSNDQVYHEMKKNYFLSATGLASYKNLCGEYYTSTAFALWLSSVILRTNSIPPVVEQQPHRRKGIKRILIYNHFRNSEHALILLSDGKV